MKLIGKIEKTLEELIFLLKAENNLNWANTLAKAKEYLDNDIPKSLSIILGIYGGMASFNDVYFENPKQNENFSILKDQLWNLAVELKCRFNLNFGINKSRIKKILLDNIQDKVETFLAENPNLRFYALALDCGSEGRRFETGLPP